MNLDTIKGRRIGKGVFVDVFECVNIPNRVIRIAKNKSFTAIREWVFSHYCDEKYVLPIIDMYISPEDPSHIILIQERGDRMPIDPKFIPQMQECLQHMESIGVSSFDVKKDNFVLSDGRPKFVDLNIAELTIPTRLVNHEDISTPGYHEAVEYVEIKRADVRAFAVCKKIMHGYELDDELDRSVDKFPNDPDPMFTRQRDRPLFGKHTKWEYKPRKFKHSNLDELFPCRHEPYMGPINRLKGCLTICIMDELYDEFKSAFPYAYFIANGLVETWGDPIEITAEFINFIKAVDFKTIIPQAITLFMSSGGRSIIEAANEFIPPPPGWHPFYGVDSLDNNTLIKHILVNNLTQESIEIEGRLYIACMVHKDIIFEFPPIRDYIIKDNRYVITDNVR